MRDGRELKVFGAATTELRAFDLQRLNGLYNYGLLDSMWTLFMYVEELIVCCVCRSMILC